MTHVHAHSMPDHVRVTDRHGHTQTYLPDHKTLVRNTTLEEDLAALSEPLTKSGSMNHAYADPHYARSLERKWGAPIDELKRRVR